jgi:hypothetical protein
MEKMKEVSKEYWKALQVALVFQVVFALLAAMILDDGQCAQFYGVSLVAWWGSFLVVVLRRSMTPTKVDLFLIRWSFPVVCFFITPFLMIFIWRIRGIDF